MPRNNKNKNRNRGQPQAGGVVAKSTSTVGPSELEQKAAIISAGIEAAENTKSALAEAKDKLEQLQKTVNSIQVNIIQSKEKSAEHVEEANPKDSTMPEEQKTDSAEFPFETQTMRKKRNRNRNKKKNGQSSGDSYVSSTAGTHESSPNVATTDTVDKPEQMPKKKEENDVKIRDVELKTVEKPNEKTNEDALIVAEKATIEKVALNVIETLSTNLDTPKKVDNTTKDAKKSPKANKKQNQKGSTPTNKSNESREQVHEEKSEKSEKPEKPEGKDTLNESRTVESTKSEDTLKAVPPQNNPLSKTIQMQELIQKSEKLVCVESKIEQVNPAEFQQEPDVLQTQPIESSDTKKNQSPKDTRNAKNNEKPQKNQQKTEIKPESKPKTKQKEEKDSSKPKQQAEVVLKTGPVNVIQETPKPAKCKPNEKMAESKPKSEDMLKAVLPQNNPFEDLVCVESIIEQTNPTESQQKLDVLQMQPIESSDTKKNQGSEETRNAKNNKKSQKSQQKTEIKPELKPETKQEEEKDSSKSKQQAEVFLRKGPVNVIQEAPKPTECKPNEKMAESKPIKDQTIEIEKVKDTAKSVEIIEKEEKIETIERPKKPSSSVFVKEEPKRDLETQNKEIIETNTSSSSLLPDQSLTKTPSSTPTAMMPAPDAAKSVNAPARTDDETAKIWKILEEASKSLEPVEIQMEDDNANSPPKAVEPPPVTASPIAITPSDEIEAKKAAHNLMALLDAKEQTTTKTKETKSEDSKSTAPKKKEQSSIKLQPRQSSESAKKGNKPHPKNVKTEQKQSKIEVPPPIVEHTPVADTEIPLDMSIISDTNIETSETTTNSKNVQGSDFVPSVEQTADEMKSLGIENVTITPKPLEYAKKEEIKSPSMNSVAKTVNNSKYSPPKSAENPSKAPKRKSNSPPKGKKSEQSNQKKNETLVSRSVEKKSEINANTTGKKIPPQQKSGQPNIPPKPDHLVNSNSKRLTDKQPNQHENKQVLAGTAEDDKDFEESYIEYKFMPRQVFIATICQSCKKSATSDTRVYCKNCQMVSYCCIEHQATDSVLHNDFCIAIQEIAKKRGGHVYNNARILNNNDYRSLRVHTLNLCENFLKRPLQTYEREILLFPRLCSMPTCREWRQNQLTDCPNCTQVYHCQSNPDHLNETHQRWCKSMALYKKLVVTQSISGRIEPSLPSRILSKPYTFPNNIEQVFQDLYKNYSAIKDECVFATVTQLATAPLTAYFAAQMSELKIGEKFTIHLVGAELQFEADILDIWETFFLHLSHKLVELTIVFCGPELNAENIPLDIISRIRMCRTCRQNCRIVKFDFQCAKLYHDYANSSAYKTPDLICFFNPGFHHISYNGIDTWSETIKNAASAGCPVIVTSYTEYESPRDLERFQMEMAKFDKPMTLIHGPQLNAYSSQRPERNFISDEVTPLIFKNFFCFIMK